MKEDPAKPLAGEKSCDLIRWGLLWKGNTEKKPSFLIGVAGKQFRKDGVGGPWPDRFGTNRAIQMGQTGEDQFEVVGNFGDGTNSAPGRADGVALAEGDGGGNSLDPIDAGSVHPFKELACVGTEGFCITALAFCIQGVESEGGFARAGRTGQDMEHAERQVERQILEVVLTGSFNADKTGRFHGVGKLALSGAATNDRLGLG